MRKLFFLAALILALFAAPVVLADGSHTTLLNAVTTPTASSSVHSNPTPGESGYENWIFIVNSPAVVVEASFNVGSSWQTVHVFEGSGLYIVPVCGGCWLRLRATVASPSFPVSGGVCVSGAVVPVVVAP